MREGYWAGAVLAFIALMFAAIRGCASPTSPLPVVAGKSSPAASGPSVVSGTPSPQGTTATLAMVTTPSGLQYKDFVVGTGPIPRTGQVVSVHYTGTFIDGKKFDSSVDRGTPLVFSLGEGQVIKGWDEGLSTMRVGGRRTLVIPANLAYGPQGRPPIIPPNTTLKFYIELLSVSRRRSPPGGSAIHRPSGGESRDSPSHRR